MTITIKLPFPLPTWNRVLDMHYMSRKELRDCTDKLVDIFTKGDINKIGVQILMLKYSRLIRPGKKR